MWFLIGFGIAALIGIIVIAAIITFIAMGFIMAAGESIFSHEQRELELPDHWYLRFCVWFNHKIFSKDDKDSYLIIKWK